MEKKREVIVIVDDDITNLTVGKNNLSYKYDVFTAPSGKKLLQILEKVSPDLILLDIDMPEMDGYETIKILKSSTRTSHIPVIFLTSKIDPENEVTGLTLGAVDYITKPFSRELILKRIDLHILFEKQRKELLAYSLNLEGEVDKKTKTVFELQNTILKTVAELIESRDGITGGHIERTQKYLRMLVAFMLERGVYADELRGWDIDLLIMSSQLHDVGKISIRDDILLKPGKLTDKEFEEIKNHTTFGVEIIKKIEEKTTESAFLCYAEILAGSHHEKWDGSGYPCGLKGQDIPLQGRLMAIVDVYDALTNDRPYKKAFTHEEAVEIIKAGIGTHFDPILCEVFLAHEKEFGSFALGKDNVGGAPVDLPATWKIVSEIVDIHSGTESDQARGMPHYLKIFTNALLRHQEWRDEMEGWDIGFFIMSAQLYDIGKITTESRILNKIGQLTQDEFENIKTHTDVGVKIIQQIKERVDDGDILNHVEAAAGSHHEKWDGTGYPLGLKGKEIPLQGRIMAIADAYDALVNDRPYRSRKTHKDAVEIIRSGSGTQFDPDLVSVFLEHEEEFEQGGVLCPQGACG